MNNDGCSRCKLRLRGLELSQKICYSCKGQIRAGNDALERAAVKLEWNAANTGTFHPDMVTAYQHAAELVREMKDTGDDPAPAVPQ